MGINLAIECHPSFMESLLPLTDFDFVLAHLCIPGGAYLDYYLQSRAQNPDRLLILDNGTNELGEPQSIREMDEVACILGPDFIIPPDWIGQSDKSWSCLQEAERVWGKRKILPVVQGECLSAVSMYARGLWYKGYETLAIPYDTFVDRSSHLDYLAGCRLMTIAYILSQIPMVKIHLLGLNTFAELQCYATTVPQVESIDTGSPFLNATDGRVFGRQALLPKGVYIDYNKEYSSVAVAYTTEMAQSNISYLKEILGGKNDN
jgi:hypothetical protein